MLSERAGLECVSPNLTSSVRKPYYWMLACAGMTPVLRLVSRHARESGHPAVSPKRSFRTAFRRLLKKSGSCFVCRVVLDRLFRSDGLSGNTRCGEILDTRLPQPSSFHVGFSSSFPVLCLPCIRHAGFCAVAAS